MESEIKRIRNLLNLSQGQFAEKLKLEEGVNIEATAIGNYERGVRSPRPFIAIAIENLAKKNGVKTSISEIYSTILNKEH